MEDESEPFELPKAINRLLERMTHLAINPLIEDLTIQFRYQHRVKLSDAIIAATATALNY
ncbi:hypothetical protein [Candidatus Methylobacter oryzae]|uniref:hypothetical protein n=1 Tax=Candidatus Methylobacter oryzae TaxID=2497749 RepID=UPI0019D658DA|nr:hypothetical protein [Candidatus Methylobacter oryzae]